MIMPYAQNIDHRRQEVATLCAFPVADVECVVFMAQVRLSSICVRVLSCRLVQLSQVYEATEHVLSAVDIPRRQRMPSQRLSTYLGGHYSLGMNAFSGACLTPQCPFASWPACYNDHVDGGNTGNLCPCPPKRKVDFAGNPPLRSTPVKAKGRDGLSPGWAQVLLAAPCFLCFSFRFMCSRVPREPRTRCRRRLCSIKHLQR